MDPHPTPAPYEKKTSFKVYIHKKMWYNHTVVRLFCMGVGLGSGTGSIEQQEGIILLCHNRATEAGKSGFV